MTGPSHLKGWAVSLVFIAQIIISAILILIYILFWRTGAPLANAVEDDLQSNSMQVTMVSRKAPGGNPIFTSGDRVYAIQ